LNSNISASRENVKSLIGSFGATYVRIICMSIFRHLDSLVWRWMWWRMHTWRHAQSLYKISILPSLLDLLGFGWDKSRESLKSAVSLKARHLILSFNMPVAFYSKIQIINIQRPQSDKGFNAIGEARVVRNYKWFWLVKTRDGP